jgi:hypothetical protein
LFLTAEDYKARVEGDDELWFIIYLHDKNSAETFYNEKFEKKLTSYGINLGFVDCPKYKKICQLVQIPSIHLYLDEPSVNPYTKSKFRKSIPFVNNLDDRSLAQFLRNQIALNATLVQKLVEYEIELKSFERPHVLLFTDSTQISIFYRVLSYRMRKFFKFVQVTEGVRELRERFNVEDRLALLFLETPTSEVVKFNSNDGDIRNMSSIVNWLNDIYVKKMGEEQIASNLNIDSEQASSNEEGNALLSFDKSLELNSFSHDNAWIVAVLDDLNFSNVEWDNTVKWAEGHIRTAQLLCVKEDMKKASELGLHLCTHNEYSKPYYLVIPFGDASRKKLRSLKTGSYTFSKSQLENARKFAAESLPENAVRYLTSGGIILSQFQVST